MQILEQLYNTLIYKNVHICKQHRTVEKKVILGTN